MRVGTGLLLVCGLLLMVSFTSAQPPGGQGKGKGKGGKGGDKGGDAKSATVTELADRMMAFDKNGDGKLTKDELTDERLHRLFDRADANKVGFVTKEQLTALAAQLQTEVAQGGDRGGRGGPGGPGGRGGPDGPGGRGRGDRGGPGGGPDGPGGRGDRGGRGPDGFGGPGGRGPGGQGPGGFGGPPQPGQ